MLPTPLIPFVGDSKSQNEYKVPTSSGIGSPPQKMIERVPRQRMPKENSRISLKPETLDEGTQESIEVGLPMPIFRIRADIPPTVRTPERPFSTLEASASQSFERRVPSFCV